MNLLLFQAFTVQFLHAVIAIDHLKSYLIDDISLGAPAFAFDQTFVYIPSGNDVVQKSFDIGDIVRTLRGPNSLAMDLFLLNDTSLITGYIDGTILQWDLNTGAIIHEINSKCAISQLNNFLGNILVACSDGINRSLLISLTDGSVLFRFLLDQFFYVYGTQFYAFNTDAGLLQYEKDFSVSTLYSAPVSYAVRQGDLIFAAAYAYFEIWEISASNGTTTPFLGPGHTDYIFDMLVVGRYLITIGHEGAMILWDIYSKKQINVLSCGSPYHLLPYNDNYILSADTRGNIVLCDYISNTVLKVIAAGRQIALSSLAVYNDNLFSGGNDVNIKEWSISSQEMLPPLPNNSYTGNVMFVISNYLLYYSDSVVIRDLDTLHITRQFGFLGRVSYINYYEGFVYSPTFHVSINKYNMSNGKLVYEFYDNQLTGNPYNLIAYGSYLYATYNNDGLASWSLVTGKLLNLNINFGTFSVFTPYESSVLFGEVLFIHKLDSSNYDSAIFYTTQTQLSVILYDFTSDILYYSGRPPIVYGVTTRYSFNLVYQFRGHSGNVNNIFLYGDFLFSCSDDGTVKQWNLLTKRIFYSFEDRSQSVAALVTFNDTLLFGTVSGGLYQFQISTAFFKNLFSQHIQSISSMIYVNDMVFVSSFDGTISAWDARSMIRIIQFEALAWSCSLFYYDGFLFSGNQDESIAQWNYTSGVKFKSFFGHHAVINDILIDGSYLFSAGSDSLICRWKVSTFTIDAKLKGHSDQVTSLALNFAGLFSSSLDKTIILWDVMNSIIIRTFVKTAYNLGHLGPVYQIITCNGYLFSASGDTTVKQWNIFSGMVVDTFFGHTKTVNCLFCLGNYLFTGSDDFAVYLWEPKYLESTAIYNSITSKGYSSLTSGSSYNMTHGYTSFLFPIVGAALFILLTTIFFVFLRYKRGIVPQQSLKSESSNDRTANLPENYSGVDSTLFTKIPGMAIPGFLELAITSFRLKKQIAKGGGGSIYLAEIFGKKETFVAKVLKDNYTDLSDVMKRAFDQEIALMDYLKTHRNIAKIVGFCREPCCFLMKYYEKGSMKNLIYSKQKLSIKQKIQYLHDISNGVEFMHSKNFIHCDLKPDNVLVDSDENGIFMVLSDFGITQIQSVEYFAAQAFEVANLGGLSVQYAAPEVFKRFRDKSIVKTSNTAGDIYALSVIMLELATRRMPWVGN